MSQPGQGFPMATAGAAGSMQGFTPPGQQNGGQYAPPPQGQNPGYNYGGYQPGHTAGGPATNWAQQPGQAQTPLGVGYVQGQQPWTGQPAPQQSTSQPLQQQPQQAPLQQPLQQQPQQQMGHAIQLQDDMILDGPNVPPELRGRPFRQVKQIYSALAQDWVRRQQAPQPPAQQPFVQQQQPFQGGQPQPVQQPPQQQRPQAPARQVYDPDFGYLPPQGGQQQPAQSGIDQQIQAAVQAAVAPLQQSLQALALPMARQAVTANIPDFAELEGEVMQIMSGASPEAASNPQAWEMAADAVRGRRARAAMQQRGPQTPYGQPPVQQQQFGPRAPQQFVPTQHPGQFFSEGPATPAVQGGDLGLSPLEQRIAEQFNMQPGQYAQFKQSLQQRRAF